MQADWLKIKQCFVQMQQAPDQPPKSCKTKKDLALAAAKLMKPRQTREAQHKLAQRIEFICFDE